jgi:hypothetical protein
MGCRKERYNLSYGSDIKKILFAWLVSLLWLSMLTPVVLADTTDIHVTFNPEGTVDIDVSPKTYDFGSVFAGGYNNSSGMGALYFTLYNNGSVTMDTQIWSNITTDSDALTLDGNGAPGQDAYSFFTDGLDADNWIPSSASTEHDSALAASGTKDFDINLTMGSPLTSNFPQQRTMINLTGSVAA